MEDTEVTAQLWNSKLPISFQLAADEIVTVEKPQPYYVRAAMFFVIRKSYFFLIFHFQLLVPRMTYFPLITEKIQNYFTPFVNVNSEDQLWLEQNGSPVKW